MAKKADIVSITGASGNHVPINYNFEALNDKLDNTISLDGSIPNAMNADLDLNGNDLINVGSFDIDTLTINGDTIQGAIIGASAGIRTIYWEGAYDNATDYTVNDGVSYNGSSYVCILNSTGNLPTDNTYWQVFAAAGAVGDGSGDLLAANNLSDLADTATAKAHLGLNNVNNTSDTNKPISAATQTALNTKINASDIGTSVQAYNTNIPTTTATQSEMEDGTETSIRSMSPLRVAQAISASSIDLATQSEMEEGTETSIRSMSPLRVAQAIEALSPPFVVFDGTTGTILDSHKVSSLVRTGTGQYTVTFTSTAFANANYMGAGSAVKPDATNDGNIRVQVGGNTTNVQTSTVTYIKCTQNQSNADYESNKIGVTFFGGQ